MILPVRLAAGSAWPSVATMGKLFLTFISLEVGHREIKGSKTLMQIKSLVTSDKTTILYASNKHRLIVT